MAEGDNSGSIGSLSSDAPGTDDVRSPLAPPLSRGERKQLKRFYEFPGRRRRTRGRIRAEVGIQVPMDDGATLETTHWFPQGGADSVVIVRTPYGLSGTGAFLQAFAEHGFHVIAQEVRGTFGSGGGGPFEPLEHEVADGAATLRWIRAQPWGGGRVFAWGQSYTGMTSWALIDGDVPPDALSQGLTVRALGPSMLYDGGGFAMDTALAWSYALGVQELPTARRLAKLLVAKWRVASASLHRPPALAPQAAVGQRVKFIEDWFEHDSTQTEWWQRISYASDLSKVPPTVILSGYQDLFLDGGVTDYHALKDAGRPVRFVLGDWNHGTEEAIMMNLREGLDLFDAIERQDALGAAGDANPFAEVAPVSVQIGPSGRWAAFDEWPPPADHLRFALTADHSLAPTTNDDPASSETEHAVLRYRYDPNDPTPSAGGRTLNPFSFGRRSQAAREARDDVVLFTSEPLASEATIVGHPVAEIGFASTNPRADLFVRLCEVDERGHSTVICDAFVRTDLHDLAGEGAQRVRVQLGAVGRTVAQGARLRLQVSSGAHPVYLRNPGTADPHHDFSRLNVSEQAIVVSGSLRSTLDVPIVSGV